MKDKTGFILEPDSSGVSGLIHLYMLNDIGAFAIFTAIDAYRRYVYVIFCHGSFSHLNKFPTRDILGAL